MTPDSTTQNHRQRTTWQHLAVLKNLEENLDFRSAQQVHNGLEQSGQMVGLATVYRNLRVLEESGQVDAIVTSSGETLYRLCKDTGHHHHLLCQSCGDAREFSLDGLEQILNEIAAKHGYHLLEHNLELFGHCAGCQENGGE